MSRHFPINERLFVLKRGESLGPFEIDEILDRLDSGEFSYDDVCLREGEEETERLCEVLDWEEDSGPQRTAVGDDGTGGGENDDNGNTDYEKNAEEWEEEDFDSRSSGRRTSAAGEPARGVGTSSRANPARNDRVLYRGHPSILTFPISFLGLVGGVVCAVWLYPLDVRISLACVSLSVLSLAWLSLRRFTREYFITGRRVELVTGLVVRSSKEVRILDIRAINVSCKGIAGVFGIGTVDFFTVGDEPEVTFQNAWAARRIKALVRKLQDRENP